MNSCCLTLYRAYSILFNLSNVKQSSLELNSKGLYQSSGKEKENCYFVFPSPAKWKNRHFHVVVVQRRQRNAHKKRDARAKVLFSQSKPIAFLPSSLTSPSSLLKLPIERKKNSIHIELKLEELFGATFWLPKTQLTTVCTPITGRTARASYSSCL